MHTMEIWVSFQSEQLTNLVHFVNKSGLLELESKRSIHFFMFCVIFRVTAITHNLINHVTMYNC